MLDFFYINLVNSFEDASNSVFESYQLFMYYVYPWLLYNIQLPVDFVWVSENPHFACGDVDQIVILTILMSIQIEPFL